MLRILLPKQLASDWHSRRSAPIVRLNDWWLKVCLCLWWRAETWLTPPLQRAPHVQWLNIMFPHSWKVLTSRWQLFPHVLLSHQNLQPKCHWTHDPCTLCLNWELGKECGNLLQGSEVVRDSHVQWQIRLVSCEEAFGSRYGVMTSGGNLNLRVSRNPTKRAATCALECHECS